MPFSTSRYQGLQEALAGYEKTGIPFLGFDGTSFKHPQFGDDEGIYYVIPKIAHVFNLHLDQAITAFYVIVIVSALILGLTGSFLAFKSRFARFFSFLSLCVLSYKLWKLGDVYIVSAAIVMAIVPIFLSFLKRQEADLCFSVYLFLSGLGIGISNTIRSQSGSAVFVFIAVSLALSDIARKRKLLLFASIILGILIPLFFLNTMLSERNSFLTKHQSRQELSQGRHIMWHSVYIGLGFINNEYGIKYLDEVAIDKVRSISPDAGYLSEKYEKILRAEVFSIVKKNPSFIVLSLSAKAGVILFYFIYFSNLGLIASFYNKKEWKLEIPFWGSLFFSALPGLLVVPLTIYMFGFFVFAILYSAIHLDIFLDSGALNHSIPNKARNFSVDRPNRTGAGSLNNKVISECVE